MTEVDPIRIECPGCHRKFRLRARPKDASRRAVKCPKCGAAIPLPEEARPPRARTGTKMGKPVGAPPLPSTQTGGDETPDDESSIDDQETTRQPVDDDLRSMLRKVKRKRSTDESSDGGRSEAEADETQPTLNIPDDTRPDDDTDPGYEVGEATMPIGQTALTADQLGTSDAARTRSASDGQAPSSRRRKRVDTPRAGAHMMNVSSSSDRRPEPPPASTPPRVDEPTYTGPAPGRTPKITPTDNDLQRFLKPGNYMVRVEDVVYAPVTEKALADIVEAGVILGVDEIATDDGMWSAIDTGDLLGGVKARLSHRAHHILARVAEKSPASDYGRPPEPSSAEPAGDPGEVARTTEMAEAGEAPEQPSPGLSPDDGSVPTQPGAAPSSEPRPPGTTDAQQTAGEPTEDDVAAPDAAEDEDDRSGRRWILVPVGMLLFLSLAAGAAWIAAPAQVEELISAARQREEVRALLGEPPAPEEPIAANPVDAGRADTIEPSDPTPAFQSAVAAVVSARAVADSIDGLLKGARKAGDEQAVTTLAWMKWQREPAAVDAHDLTERLMKRGDWRNARRVANWLIATEGGSERLEEVVATSLEKQFAEETPVEVTTERFPALVHVDPGHRPALVLRDAEGARWTVWPDHGDDDWRGDIAVYRLCQLMVCHFEIPETRPMTMSRDVFRDLVKSADEQVAEMARKVRSDFDWEKKTLEGSIRKLPEAVPWPIEATTIWRPWLTTGNKGPAVLAEDATEAHLKTAFLGAEKVLPELEGVTARQLARQLSSLLLVDYLVGNWNRFAPREDQWGSRTLLDHGLIYSADDSAAFLGDGSVRVKGRFSWSQRFSKATIDSLEKLEEEKVNDLLFPDADKQEKEKLERFWSQRRRALRRVSKLVKEYGSEDVFALDAPTKDKDGK